MDIGIIYKIRNIVNNKVYIGKTIQKLDVRIYDHFSKWSNCTKLKKAIEEFDSRNFEVSVLEENIPYNMLDERETFYIKLYNSVKEGYNIKEGNSKFRGRATHAISQEIKKKVKEDYLNGVSPLDIADHFKICITSVYNILSEVKKRYNKGGFNSKSNIDLQKLIQLKAQGYKTTYIANYFGVAKSSIKRYVNRHKDIIFPRVSDILASKVEDENVL